MKKLTSNLSEDDALRHLDELDRDGGVNVDQVVPKEQPKLGKLKTSNESNISSANDSRWKIIPFNSLPSLGQFYPDDSEISIRSASVLEIRHWSTIDENDLISINDCLNFILEKCLRFKIKERPVMLSWKDITMLDRFYLIFRIHELTFPNGENKLMKKFSCDSCSAEPKFNERLPVKSSMLQGYSVPDELQEFYDPTGKAFVINSSKFGTLYLFMPTLGTYNIVKKYISDQAAKNKSVEKWFIKVLPYLIEDFESVNTEILEKLRMETLEWHQNKLMFVTRAVDLLEGSKSSHFTIKCPKCSNDIRANIFSSDSFTVKNLFIFSARLADLI